MLNKETCKKCYISRYSQQSQYLDSKFLNHCFELKWNDKKCVLCSCKSVNYSHLEINKNIPLDCPYLLEATLRNQENV